MKQGIELLSKNKLGSKEYISWAAYHASLLPSHVDPSSLIALLPLLYEKAATVAMVKHGMDIQQQITEYLNPGQIPVTAFDQPLFTLAKYVQWHWPDSLGEKCHVVMFGGLHVEMALWNTIGDFLESSGWTTALCESEVASSGTADSFLNATHLTRTRHAHQVTALALSVLQNDAWQQQRSSNGDASFETWRKNMIEKSPTFQFWYIVLRYEILVLIFIHAHRTQNFDLYVETLEALVPWFFALDHTNYARWVPVHIRDMKCLPHSIKEQFKSSWVVQKTQKKFSYIPIDQAHKQNNKNVKGSGGAVGLTENPSAFRRWMIAGTEQARLLLEFESQFLDLEDPSNEQHEQCYSSQEAFHSQVKNLTEAISTMGNPFLDASPELIVLDSRNCAGDAIVTTIRSIENLDKSRVCGQFYQRTKSHNSAANQEKFSSFIQVSCTKKIFQTEAANSQSEE